MDIYIKIFWCSNPIKAAEELCIIPKTRTEFEFIGSIRRKYVDSKIIILGLQWRARLIPKFRSFFVWICAFWTCASHVVMIRKTSRREVEFLMNKPILLSNVISFINFLMNKGNLGFINSNLLIIFISKFKFTNKWWWKLTFNGKTVGYDQVKKRMKKKSWYIYIYCFCYAICIFSCVVTFPPKNNRKG